MLETLRFPSDSDVRPKSILDVKYQSTPVRKRNQVQQNLSDWLRIKFTVEDTRMKRLIEGLLEDVPN